MTAQYLV